MDIKAFLTKKNLIIASCALVLIIVLILVIVLNGNDKDTAPDLGNNIPESNQPSEAPEAPDSNDGSLKPELISYEEYLSFTSDRKAEYYESFEDYRDFYAWLNAAKAEYEEQNNNSDLGSDGNIDVEDIFGDK